MSSPIQFCIPQNSQELSILLIYHLNISLSKYNFNINQIIHIQQIRYKYIIPVQKITDIRVTNKI